MREFVQIILMAIQFAVWLRKRVSAIPPERREKELEILRQAFWKLTHRKHSHDIEKALGRLLSVGFLLTLVSCASLIEPKPKPAIDVHVVGLDQSICKDQETKTDCLAPNESEGRLVVSPVLMEFMMEELSECRAISGDAPLD